ncbi:tetratricopeptide repeat protein [candidate division WOR-3 bacterium]|nr:tetratricopeptide repeat protein [candidate division WOR-3 bacterium]
MRYKSSINKGLWGGLVLLLSVFNLLPAQASVSSIVTRLKSSTVTIITYDVEGEYLSTGCGFFTSKQDVVTARHVIKGAYSAEIQTSNGRSYSVKEVVAEDKEGDLVRLSVDIPSELVDVIVTTPVPAQAGEGIVVVGPETSNRSKGREILEGKVSAVRLIQGFGTIIEISAPLTPGYSGSPVVNMAGDVIGIATFQVVAEEQVNFAVPAERVSRLIPRDPKSLGLWEAERSRSVKALKEDLYLTGIGLLWAEEWETALYCFKGVVTEDPLYVIAYPLIGLCNLQLGRWDDAAQAYRQTLLIDPDDATAYNHLATAYAKMERWGEAVAAYRQAARLEPDEPAHLFGLGIAYSKVGEWTNARESFKGALDLDPRFAQAHYGLGLCYWALEDDDAAWQEYWTLKELDVYLAEELLETLKQ